MAPAGSPAQAKAIVGSAPDHELLPRSGSKFQAAKAKAMKLWSEASRGRLGDGLQLELCITLDP